MEHAFDTARFVAIAKTVGAAIVESRTAKNELKGAFVEARIVGKLSDADAYDIMHKGLEAGAKATKGGSKGLTESELTLIRQDVAQARKLVANWEHVPANLHVKIFTGQVKISTQATKAIAARDAAKRNAEAEAATIAANEAAPAAVTANDTLPEDGSPKGADGQPRKVRADSSAVAKGMAELAAWLGNVDSMSDAEAVAFVALQEAIAAFNAKAVPLAEAA